MPGPEISAETREQIIDLQTRLAYQEHTLNALSDEVAVLQQRIEHLNAALGQLASRLSTLPHGDPPEPEPPPPHY
jgi:SlyX protein